MNDATLKIEYLPVSVLKPYKRNARKHSAADVDAIADSIRRYGFNDSIAVWGEDLQVVCGHGRLLAAKKLGLTEVPVVRLDHMTDEERRAYAIQHNRTAELSEWDFGKLKLELPSLPSLDLRGLDVELGFKKAREKHEKEKEEAQWRVCNILNLAEANYPGVGKYDIPALEPVTELPPIKEWIDFTQITQDAEPEGKGVHFFVNDFKFERIWKEPRKYVERLQKYACVATPDFSPYGDMPFAAALWNHYRKHWVGAFLQENGVTVIPTLRSSTNPKFDEVWLDGEPPGGIVIMSSMWAKRDEDETESTRRFREVVERLRPKKVFIYGHDRRFPLKGAEVEWIDNFTLKRFGS